MACASITELALDHILVIDDDGEELDLSSVEFDVLELLLRNAGQVISREQIAKVVLGKSLFTPALDRSDSKCL